MGYRLDDIIKRIHEEKGVSFEEIERRIRQKLDKLSGLISREGAAHIVANELGVDLISSMKKHGVRIAQIMPGMRNVTVVGSVVKDYGVRVYQKEKSEGKVWSFLVGDESGTLRIVVWDTQLMTQMEQKGFGEGVVLRVSDGFIKENNGYREMHLGNRSTLEVNPAGVTIGQVKTSTGPSYIRKSIRDIREGEHLRLIGTVVQVMEPKFYEGCSHCGRKLDGGNCKEHGGVAGVMVPILNFYFDDGTGTVQAVAFRDMVGRALDAPSEQVVGFHKSLEGFDAAKQRLLGKPLILQGKIQKNMLFDRLEFMVSAIDEANPEELIQELSGDS
jgi:replication factor A1